MNIMEKIFREKFQNEYQKNIENVEIVLASEEKKRLNEIDFIDDKRTGFSREDIQRDIEATSKMEERFKKDWDYLSEKDIQRIKEGKKKSEALEVIIIDKGEKLGWFGCNARLSRTSKFDDIFNGVDGIVEFDKQEDNPYGIALEIDASMNPDKKVIKRKIARNTDKVLGRGKPIEIKYFQSKITGEKKKLTFVVPVIVGTEGNNANRLIQLFADIERLKKSEKNEEARKKLEEAKNDPAQIIFLRETKIQLEMYVSSLEKEGGLKQLYKKEVEKLAEIINNILNSKNHINSERLESDRVYNLIKEFSR